MSQVTSYKFSFYDVAKYSLDNGHDTRLSDLNRSLLMLFNNDLWLYSKINGAYRGLWWRKWCDGVHLDGYALGDTITLNGIDDLPFLRQNWTYVKRVWDSSGEETALPDFRMSSIASVMLYKEALAKNFKIGSSDAPQQLYVSMKESNYERVDNQDAWSPYILTSSELEDRSIPMMELFKSSMDAHEGGWHSPCLDEMDAQDEEFESGTAETSVWEGLLSEYAPKQTLSFEHPEWAEFVGSARGLDGRDWDGGSVLLGLGATAHDFMHLVKPLGDEIHLVEAWLRSDGHVRIHGKISIPEIEDITSESMTATTRVDFPLDDEVSNLWLLTSTAISPVWICPIDCAIADSKRETKYEVEVNRATLADKVRLFGSAKIPRLERITKRLSAPEARDILTPLDVPPTMEVLPPRTPYGQLLSFSLASSCRNLEFTLEGIAQKDFIEDCRPEFFDTRVDGSRLKWQGIVLEWMESRDRLQMLDEFGIHSDALSLAKCTQEMFSRLKSMFIDSNFYGAHFLARNVRIEPLKEVVLAMNNEGSSSASVESLDSNVVSALELLHNGYDALYKTVEWLFLYSGWYNRYLFKTAEEYGDCKECIYMRQQLAEALYTIALGDYPTEANETALMLQKFATDNAETLPESSKVLSALAESVLSRVSTMEEMKRQIEGFYETEGLGSSSASSEGKIEIGEIARRSSIQPFLDDCESIARYAGAMTDWLNSSASELAQVEALLEDDISNNRTEDLMLRREEISDSMQRAARVSREVSIGYLHYLSQEGRMLDRVTETYTARNSIDALLKTISEILGSDTEEQ